MVNRDGGKLPVKTGYRYFKICQNPLYCTKVENDLSAMILNLKRS